MGIFSFFREVIISAFLKTPGPTLSDDAAIFELATRIDALGLSYLGVDALVDLAKAMIVVNGLKVPGIVLEAGCALGGSAIILAAAKGADRLLHVYDVFGVIPAPSVSDGPEVHQRYAIIRSGRSEGLNGRRYYGYDPDLLATISENFNDAGYPPHKNSVSFVKGLYENTLYPECPVALAHIDCDWYESVKVCLERIGPHISRGGRMIIDDYDYYSGCRRAVDEFLNASGGRFVSERFARLHLVRSYLD